MVNQQLLDYIKQRLAQGATKEAISSGLVSQGWQTSDIEEAFNLVSSSNPSVSPQDTTSQPFSTLSQQPEKGINKSLLIVISIIGVLIIGGGVFGYLYYFQESPEKIIQKMGDRLAEVKSLEYQGEIKAEITTSDLLSGGGNLLQPVQSAPSQQVSDFSINFSGKSDVSDLNNPRGSFVFNIRTDALRELTQEDSVFGLELRTISQAVYLKLSNIPNLGFFDLSFITNQWIRIDTEALKKQFGLEKLEKQIKEAQKQKELSPEQIEEIKRVGALAKVLKITDKLPSEKIDGVETYHYKFVIDKEGLKKLVIDISFIVQDKTLTEKEVADFDKSLEIIESLGGEIWIGKKDLLPYKIFLQISVKETDESKISGKLTLMILFKNYNKPVQIDVPSPVKNLEEILSELFGGFFGNGQLEGFQPSVQLPGQ